MYEHISWRPDPQNGSHDFVFEIRIYIFLEPKPCEGWLGVLAVVLVVVVAVRLAAKARGGNCHPGRPLVASLGGIRIDQPGGDWSRPTPGGD